jgi:AraC-like DNA-binding protein
LVILLVSFCDINATTSSNSNPFLEFANKSYGRYHYALRDTMRMRYKTPTEECCRRTVRQMKEVPDVFHNGQWEMEAKFFELKFRHDHMHVMGDAEFEDGLQELVHECQKWKNKVFEIKVQRKLLDFYIGKHRLYEASIAMIKVENLLKVVTIRQFPDVVDFKMRLATIYMDYNDYVNAEKYFNAVMNSPMIAQVQQIYLHARNDMGLIYRNFHHDYDKSDQWFRSIYDFYNKYHSHILYKEWDAVVTGNLGTNEMLRGHYPRAIQLLSKAFDTKFAMRDYNYCYIMAYNLVNCYCEINDYSKAKFYIGKADECYAKSPLSVESSNLPTSRENYFTSKTKYYIGIGDSRDAFACLDSAKQEKNKYIQQYVYNTNVFSQIESSYNKKVARREAARKSRYKQLYFTTLNISLTITILLALCLFLYLKKRAAYRELVKRSRRLADQMFENDKTVTSPPVTATKAVSDDTGKAEAVADEIADSTTGDNDNALSNEKISQILEKAKEYIAHSKCFLDTDFSIDQLAREVGVNRTYLSVAINADGGNFRSFINEYGVNYAIKLLTADKTMKFEDLAVDCGFNNRKSLYNAFKSVTGITPSHFREN